MQVWIGSQFKQKDTLVTAVPENCVEDANEGLQPGQSSTKMPKEHIFRNHQNWVCLIDTPGIGDTKGIEADKENFDNI